MAKRKRELPIHIRKLQALSRRLVKTHPSYQKIADQVSRHMAGYHGEKSLDFYLDYLPEDQYKIMTGLRLFDGVH